MFKIFCRHKWKILASIKAPPKGSFNVRGLSGSEYILKEMVFGKQTIVFSCEKCGKIIEKDYIGELNERE